MARPDPRLQGREGEDPVLAFDRIRELTTAVAIVTLDREDGLRGAVIDDFLPVSTRPPVLLVSLDAAVAIAPMLREGERFGFSVLADDQPTVPGRFAAGAGDAGPDMRIEHVLEVPVIEGALAHVVARVTHAIPGGDHALVLAQAEYARCDPGSPLVARGRHHPLSAPEGSILGALPPAMREKLLSAGEEHEFDEGDTVIRQGERGAQAFVILSGRARVVRDGQTLARLGAGQFFGEVAMLDGRPRTADVVAESRLRCIALPRETVKRALASEPDLAWRVLEVLASRIRG